jgi:DNA-binding response OmpR family regulator
MTTPPKKILVVSEQEAIKKVAQNFFQNMEVSFAQKGEEVLLIPEKNTPHLILLDSKLSDMSSPDFCKKIKESATLSRVPVVIHLDPYSLELEERCFFSHCDAILENSLKREEIMARFNTLLEPDFSAKDSFSFSAPVRVKGKGVNQTVNSLKINAQGIWLETQSLFSPTQNYRISFPLSKPDQVVETWAKQRKRVDQKGKYQVFFQFLNLKAQDNLAIGEIAQKLSPNRNKEKGLDLETDMEFESSSDKIPLEGNKKNPLQRKATWIALFLIILLVPIYFYATPKSLSVLPPDVHLDLKTPIPLINTKKSESNLFLYVSPEWKKIDTLRKTELMTQLLIEIQPKGYRRVLIFDEKGNGMGSAKVGGKIQFVE